MGIEDIVARCSKFSGWNLTYVVEGSKLSIWDPKDMGKSRLTVCLMWWEGSQVLHEVYGRLRHWAISPEEQMVMVELLR